MLNLREGELGPFEGILRLVGDFEKKCMLIPGIKDPHWHERKLL